MNHLVELSPAAEELAARQAEKRGQSLEEYLSVLVTDILAQKAAEELPEAGPDSLSFWEQEMERRRPEPEG